MTEAINGFRVMTRLSSIFAFSLLALGGCSAKHDAGRVTVPRKVVHVMPNGSHHVILRASGAHLKYLKAHRFFGDCKGLLWDAETYDPIVIPKAVRSKIPDPSRISASHGHWAVMSQGGRITKQTGAIFIFDSKWRSLGPVKNLPISNFYEIYWSPDGLWLYAICYVSKGIVIGAVDASTWRFSSIYHVPSFITNSDVGFISRISHHQNLILLFQSQTREGLKNKIVEFDARHRSYDELYSEVSSEPNHTVLQYGMISLDGRYLAFDRGRIAVYNCCTNGLPTLNERNGIWILDLKTKKCMQLTSDASDLYSHSVCSWTSARKLRFEADPDTMCEIDFDKSFQVP